MTTGFPTLSKLLCFICSVCFIIVKLIDEYKVSFEIGIVVSIFKVSFCFGIDTIFFNCEVVITLSFGIDADPIESFILSIVVNSSFCFRKVETTLSFSDIVVTTLFGSSKVVIALFCCGYDIVPLVGFTIVDAELFFSNTVVNILILFDIVDIVFVLA